MTKTPLLEMSDITKSFPGVRALDRASLTVMPGEVHALMGENGAGKSTLMKCLFGVYRRDGGSVRLFGEEVDFRSSKEALSGGVAMVHQELNQALKLSISDNLWLGRYPRISKYLPFVDERTMQRRTAELLASVGLNASPKAKMSTLSVSERQTVEIAKAVSYGARVIVFDEPTSSLSEKEAERLFEIIDRLKREGRGIIYISHKMNEILRICDTVTVMRDGVHIATKPSGELTTDKIISLMVGRELENRFPKKSNTPGGVLLEVRELSGGTRLSGATLKLRAGEVLGIAGLDGSGRTELLEGIFGLSPVTSGEIYLSGKKIQNRSPIEAIKNGFALLTEERRRTGIFGILDIRENSTAASLGKFSKLIFISDRRRDEATERNIRAMKIKTPSMRTKIQALSGGNQQKVILGRWLLTEPRVLLLDEPTRGVDVGAKYEIYALIDKLAAAGRGVIVVSSEMPELLGISDRIAVMSGGRVAGTVDPKETTQEERMTLAAKYI